MTTREQIYQLASDILGVPEASLRPDAPFALYAVDSLDIVEFVFAVQEQFHVHFESAEFEGLKTLDDLIAAVNSKLNPV